MFATTKIESARTIAWSVSGPMNVSAAVNTQATTVEKTR